MESVGSPTGVCTAGFKHCGGVGNVTITHMTALEVFSAESCCCKNIRDNSVVCIEFGVEIHSEY